MSMRIPQIEHRDNLGAFLVEHGLDTEGAEIGCAFGGNAKQIMGKAPKLRLHMIDPYEKQNPLVYPEEGIEVKPYEAWFKEVSDLPAQGFNCVIHRKYSVDAALEFMMDGRRLDFVYLDGNHAKEAVLSDMRAWWHVLNKGGLMAGHDFTYINDWTQVYPAVCQFSHEVKVPFSVGLCGSWFMFKPI